MVFPALVWFLILLAAPFLSFPPDRALPWGTGAALFVGVFPAALVFYLQRHHDLRQPPLILLPPAVLATAAMAAILQWAILWLNGPLPLAAAAFGLIAAALALMAANSATSWSWLDISLGAGVVILVREAQLLFPGLPGTLAGVCLAAVLLLSVAVRMRQGRPARRLAAAATGALAGGGVFLWLLSVTP